MYVHTHIIYIYFIIIKEPIYYDICLFESHFDTMNVARKPALSRGVT